MHVYRKRTFSFLIFPFRTPFIFFLPYSHSGHSAVCLSPCSYARDGSRIFEKGHQKFRDRQNFVTCGDRGCLRKMHPLRSGKKKNSLKSICTIWCILFVRGAHTKSSTLSLQKIEGAHPLHPLLICPCMPCETVLDAGEGCQRCILWKV